MKWWEWLQVHRLCPNPPLKWENQLSILQSALSWVILPLHIHHNTNITRWTLSYCYVILVILCFLGADACFHSLADLIHGQYFATLLRYHLLIILPSDHNPRGLSETVFPAASVEEYIGYSMALSLTSH